MNLSGKTALITGGSKGIGKAIAQLFLENEANVCITSKNPKILKSTADEIGAFGVPGDITKEAQVKNVVQKTIKKFSKIDILVNNAGIYSGVKPLHKTTEKEWNSIIDVNLSGAFRFVKHVIPHMIKNQSGSIVNISSNSGIRPAEDVGASAYGASKAAIIFLTKMWALEYAKNKIRFNCVAPGTTNTDLTKSYIKSQGIKKVNSEHPLGRIGTPKEIAKAVLYFASDDSQWSTGSVLAVDGGVSAQ